MAGTENYLILTSQMPELVGWLEDSRKAFKRLRSLLEWHHPQPAEENEIQNFDSTAVTADRARAAASPVITILESGNHALGLSARNEPLQCLAFGTVTPKLFWERFWEVFLKQEQNSVAVYEASDFTGRYRFRFQGHLFQIVYIQAEVLVRAHQDILSVPANTIQSQFHCSKDIYEVVRNLQEESEHVTFFEIPHVRRAYFYLRAWIIAQGRFRNPSFKTGRPEVTTRDIVRMLAESNIKPELETTDPFSGFLAKFEASFFSQQCRELGLLSLSQSASSSCDWLEALQSLEAKPVPQRMGCEHYILIHLLHNGSGLERSRWLSMVERRLPKLKTRLETIQAKVFIWPQRLIEVDQNHGTNASPVENPQAYDYEAYYILGFTFNNFTSDLREAVQTATEKWKQLTSDGDHNKSFINLDLHSPSTVEKLLLKPCPLELVQEPINPPTESHYQNEDEQHQEMVGAFSLKHKKGTKGSEIQIPHEEQTRKLRPASDVLKRLKHDRTFNIDEYKVGYNDRHSARILEKPASSWTTDTTADEFIPEHRIEYFKRYPVSGGEPVIMWSRQTREDKIFKNSGK